VRLIITDTNVLFDVVKIGALPEFFSLDYEICTTIFVIEEIKTSPQRKLLETFIRAKKLTVFEFTGEEIDEIENSSTVTDLKRFTDKSIIWKSLQFNCTMLTGDKKMRVIAEKMGLEVHGSIWVIDELINKDLISGQRTILLLEKLMVTNRWLPRNEIEKRINKLKMTFR
jgi:predicted nucleic acid-binding protein